MSRNYVYPELPDWRGPYRRLRHYSLHDGSQQYRLGWALVNVYGGLSDVTVVLLDSRGPYKAGKVGKITFEHFSIEGTVSTLQAASVLTELKKSGLTGERLAILARNFAKRLTERI